VKSEIQIQIYEPRQIAWPIGLAIDKRERETDRDRERKKVQPEYQARKKKKSDEREREHARRWCLVMSAERIWCQTFRKITDEEEVAGETRTN